MTNDIKEIEQWLINLIDDYKYFEEQENREEMSYSSCEVLCAAVKIYEYFYNIKDQKGLNKLKDILENSKLWSFEEVEKMFFYDKLQAGDN